MRAVAATALGRLGHRAALPALTAAGSGDRDPSVRAAARDAAAQVAALHRLPGAGPAATPARDNGRGPGAPPRALEPQPALFVRVNSSTDESPGVADRATRKRHAEIVRQALERECAATDEVTTAAPEAARLGLAARHIDASVVHLRITGSGATVEVDARLRLAISDASGKLLSFVSGGAKLKVPRHKLTAGHLPQLRREALEGATRGMFDKLLAHLRDQPRS